MKKALGLAGKYVIMFLSCLFPRSRKIYIFGAWLGEQFADNPKYLFLEAQEHKEIRPIWITKNESICRKVRELGYEAYMFDSFKGILMQLRAKYVVVCNGISDVNHTFMGRAVFLNLWHGVPLKKVGYDDDKVKNWDSKGQKIRRMIQEIPLGKEYVVATSDFYAPIYESAFRRSKSHIITLGQPRNDIFYDQSGKFHASHQLSKAAKGKKVILYTPTHRKEGKVVFPLEEHFDFKVLNDWCIQNDILFVIRRHFYHKDEKVDFSMYSNITDITERSMDIQELLMDTDILVTDYSSTYIDYLLLDRPVVFYNFDYQDYLEHDRGMYCDYEKAAPGYKAETFEALMEEFERLVQGEDHFKEVRRQARDFFYCKEGQGMVGETLLGILKNIK